MARQREFNPDDVLEVAVNLFWEKGYFDTSVDEVVRRSGVAKYGVYGVFGSKHELFKKALAKYAEDRRKGIQAPLRRERANLDDIMEFFANAVAYMADETGPHGCLFVKAGLELGRRDSDIKRQVDDFFGDAEKVLAGCLGRAVAAGQLTPMVETSRLAAYLIMEYRVMLMMSGSGASGDEIKSHMDIALRVLN